MTVQHATIHDAADSAHSARELRDAVARALPRLWRYLKSWQTTDGRFAGMIATWWSSYVETAVPHPMNQFPILLGLLELHRARVAGGEWLAEAQRVGDGLASSVDARGYLDNGWGDIPGKSTGPIFYTACVRALAALHEATPLPTYRDAALRMDGLVTRIWTRGDLLTGALVSNQVLSWAQSKLWLARMLDQPALAQDAARIARAELVNQISEGPLAGAFYQGRFDDRLMTIYVGKCIAPLVEIGRAVGDDALIHAARRTADYLTRQDIDPGIWLNVRTPGGLWMKLMRPITSLDRRVFRYAVPVYRLRRAIQSWETVDYPSWLARSADPIRALWELSDAGAIDPAVPTRYTRRLLAMQLPHGGFPNTVGFFGDAARSAWQDAAPCTRWNAYVFLLLCRLARTLDVKSLDEPPRADDWRTPLADDSELIETRESIEQQQRGELCWRIAKNTGLAEHVAPAWRGDLSGHRGDPWRRNA